MTTAHAMTQELRMFCRTLASILIPLLLSAACTSNEALTHQGAAERNSPPVSTSAEDHPRPDAHNSRNALDWAGIYSGVLPCASCPGIETEITLHSDGTFERSRLYQDEAVASETDKGTFAWNKAGSKIELNTDGDETVEYQVGENQLFRLDRHGQRIDGELAAHYVLQKHLQDSAIENKRWKLIELRGSPVETERDVLLKLNAEGAIASGHASCNSFSSSYVIKSGQRISFNHNMVSTLMACADMNVEQGFFEVLRMADNYSLSNNGQLSLSRARMAPLARFELL